MINFLAGCLCKDIAIDLGTSNIVIYTQKDVIVLNEPSIIAYKKGVISRKNIVAIGKEAYDMIGKTHNDIEVIQPMRDGVIANFKATEILIRMFIERVFKRNYFIKPRILACLPREVTKVERKAVKDLVLATGAKEVLLIDEPIAAAIGADADISKANGVMVVDIGAGTSEVGVISLSGLVLTRASRVAGDKIDMAIIDYIRQKYNVFIGLQCANKIKLDIASASELKNELQTSVKGRDGMGYLVTLNITSQEIREAIADTIKQITEATRAVLENMPPELSSDIFDNGIILTGGGALLRGLDTHLSRTLRIPVYVANDPLLAVINGMGKLLGDDKLLKSVIEREQSHKLAIN